MSLSATRCARAELIGSVEDRQESGTNKLTGFIAHVTPMSAGGQSVKYIMRRLERRYWEFYHLGSALYLPD